MSSFSIQKDLSVSDVNCESLQVAGDLTVGGALSAGSILPAPSFSMGNLNTAGGAASPTAAQVMNGYTYVGAAGAAVALTLPTGAALQAALLSVGVVSGAGVRLLNPLSIDVTDAFALTVTGAAGATVAGSAAVNNTSAVVHITFSAAAAYTAVVVVGA